MQELQHIGLNPGTISSLGVITFGMFGAFGQWHQVALIWRMRSVTSVSLRWTVVFAVHFLSYVVYGLHTDKIVLVFIGSVRFVFYPLVLAGMYFFGTERLSAFDKVLCSALVVMSAVMLATPAQSDLFFKIFGYLGVALALDQPYRIWKNKTTGAVSIIMLVTFTCGSFFWTWYALTFNDTPLLWLAISFLAVYAVTIVTWLAYRPRRMTLRQLC